VHVFLWKRYSGVDEYLVCESACMSVYDTGASGHFYCGQRVLTCSCCEGRVCGPGSGCNCAACKQLDLDAADARQQQADTSDSRGISSAEMIGSWTWGKQPGQCCCNGCSSTELLSRSQTIDKVGQLLGRGLVSKDNRQMKCTTSKLLTCRVTNGDSYGQLLCCLAVKK